jgi:hypothetical protein
VLAVRLEVSSSCPNFRFSFDSSHCQTMPHA